MNILSYKKFINQLSHNFRDRVIKKLYHKLSSIGTIFIKGTPYIVRLPRLGSRLSYAHNEFTDHFKVPRSSPPILRSRQNMSVGSLDCFSHSKTRKQIFLSYLQGATGRVVGGEKIIFNNLKEQKIIWYSKTWKNQVIWFCYK